MSVLRMSRFVTRKIVLFFRGYDKKTGRMRNHTLSVAVLILLCLNIWLLFRPPKLLGEWNDTQCEHYKVKKSLIDNQERLSIDCPTPRYELPPQCRLILDQVDTSKGLILGKGRQNQVFLSIGFVARDYGSEIPLIKALGSLFNHVMEEEKEDVVFITAVGTHESPSINLLSTEFQTWIKGEWLQIVAPSREFRNLFEKKNVWQGGHNFTKGFKKHARELNIKLIFLMEYARRTSKFYLQLNDQTKTTMRFLPIIKNEITTRNISDWFSIMFSKLQWVSLGRLYQTRYISQITEVGSLFESVILPYDILTSFLYYKMSNNKLIEAKEKPFTLNKIKRGDPKPKATVKTTMSFQNPPDWAYSSDTGVFWGHNPNAGQYFEIVFENPITPTALRVDTGTAFYQDFVSTAVLEACIVNKEISMCDSKDYKQLALFRDPVLELSNLQDILKGDIKTLRIYFLERMHTWLVIQDIALWLKKN